MYKRLGLSAFLLMLSFSAKAALLGSTVSVCADSAYNSGSVTASAASCDAGTAQLSPTSAVVVDPGVEFSLTNTGSRTFDFSNDTLTVTYNNVTSSSPDLYVFEFEDVLSSISLVGLNLLNSSTIIDGKYLGLLVSSPLVNGSVTYQFGATEVPVPAAIWLFVSGLIGFSAMRKRQA